MLVETCFILIPFNFAGLKLGKHLKIEKIRYD